MASRTASHARAYLENMRRSRARRARIPTLSRAKIEVRLDALLRQQGEHALNRLRGEARDIATELGLEAEFDELNTLVGALLGKGQAKSRGREKI